MKSFESIARRAFEKFQCSLQRSSMPLPAWDDLTQATKDAWIAAARQVAEEIQQLH